MQSLYTRIAAVSEWALAFLGLFFAFLHSGVQDDGRFAHSDAFIALVITLSFILGIWSLGDLLGRKFFAKRGERFEFLAFGIITILGISFLSFSFGFIGHNYQWCAPVLSFTAFLVAKITRSPGSIRNLFEFSICLDQFFPVFKREKDKGILTKANTVLLSLAFITLFTARIFQVLSPNQHGDPLYYHLLAPQLWVAQGNHNFYELFPLAYLASYWEYIYGYCMSIFYGGPNTGLIAGQIAGQTLHLILGYFFSGYLLFRLFKNLGFARIIAGLAVLAALTVRELQWTAAIAKNDWGITTLFLISLIYLVDPFLKLSRRAFFLTTFFVALSFAARPGTMYSIIGIWLPFFCLRVYESKYPKPRILLLAFLGGLIGLAPLYFRNYMATGNPLFPFFENVFHTGKLAESYIEYVSVYQGFLGLNSWGQIGARFLVLTKQSLFIPFLVFSPLLWFVVLRSSSKSKRIEEDKDTCRLAIFSLTTLALFLFFAPPLLIIRYLGPTLPIASALGLIIFFSWCSYLLRWRAATLFPYIAFLTMIAILANSKIPLHVVKKYFSSPPPSAQVRTHTGGSAKHWLRRNASPSDMIILAGESEAYYLAHLQFSVLTENYDLDQIYREYKNSRPIDALEFLRQLRHAGARYYMESFPVNDDLSRQIRLAVRTNHRHALAFESGASIIIDLSRI